nr:uncharacterized protein LOC105318576 isoform X2 [Crassostrea gigas]
MTLSRYVSRWTTGEQRIFMTLLYFMSMQGLVRSTITVNVASQSTWVNYGDNYTANCNIPGLDALEISQLRVEWFHNGQRLTSQCLLLSAEIKQKYSCITVTPEWNNISLLLTVKRNLKFKCTNACAIVNKKRHMIMCEVYDTGGISCNTILWKRGDTGENYSPGSYNNINVTCKEVTNSTIETTLGIQQVTAEYFKTSFSVIYNGPLSRTIEYHLSIPEEYSNPAAAVQPFLALIYSIILAAILLKIQ